MTDRHIKLALDLAVTLAILALLAPPSVRLKLRTQLQWLTYYAALAQWQTARATAPAWLKEALKVRGRI
jgi:hypothetical protein